VSSAVPHLVISSKAMWSEITTLTTRSITSAGLSRSDDMGINLGFGVEGSTRTTVSHNTVAGSGAVGILACSDKGNPCVSTDNMIVGNLVEGNGFRPSQLGFGTGREGIKVVATPSGPDPGIDIPTRDIVADNTIVGNAEDGLLVHSQQNRFYGNYSVGNAVVAGVNAVSGYVFDLHDVEYSAGLPNCDSNIWANNTYGTAFPPCATGGTQIGSQPAISGASPSLKTAGAATEAPPDAGFQIHRSLPTS